MTRHKHADLIHAWAEGEVEIEVYDRYQKAWMPCTNPSWVRVCMYRAKPTTKITKYRNYVTEDGRIGVLVKGEEPPADMSMWLDDWLELESEI